MSQRKKGRAADLMARIAWGLLAVVFIALGVIGAALPVVPAVPFLLLAAAAASRGWPWLNRQLTAHPVCGPLIQQWKVRRALPRAIKYLAALGMVTSCVLLWFTPLPLWSRLALPVVMAAAGWWMWNRPED